MSADQKAVILSQVRQEAAINNARNLISKLNHHCFAKCVPSPGASLSTREQTCLTTCMEKYMATWNAVNKTYISRAQAGQAAAVMTDGMGGLSL